MVDELEARSYTQRYDSSLSILIITNKMLLSLEQGPKLELKYLPTHLKYAYLGDEDTLPDIVSSSLNEQQEHKC